MYLSSQVDSEDDVELDMGRKQREQSVNKKCNDKLSQNIIGVRPRFMPNACSKILTSKTTAKIMDQDIHNLLEEYLNTVDFTLASGHNTTSIKTSDDFVSTSPGEKDVPQGTEKHVAALIRYTLDQGFQILVGTTHSNVRGNSVAGSRTTVYEVSKGSGEYCAWETEASSFPVPVGYGT